MSIRKRIEAGNELISAIGYYPVDAARQRDSLAGLSSLESLQLEAANWLPNLGAA